jgi:cyclohexyl-isocyanide hydratase
VTAGLDFGLSVLAELLGQGAARIAQLAMEYDPAPPFHSGPPQRASPAHVEAVRGAVEPVDVEVARVAADLERWGWGRGRVA